MQQPKISQKQRLEWLENPVTIEFKGIIDEAHTECLEDKGIDSYFIGEPHRTQEALAQIVGAAQAFDIVMEALGGSDVSSTEDSGTSE